MSTLDEIKAAAGELAWEEQCELIKHLLRTVPPDPANRPKPRQFTKEQIAEWIRLGDEEMRQLEAEGYVPLHRRQAVK